MRLVKVILSTLVLSFIISLFGSLKNYTPISQREPDVYYLSVWESFNFKFMYLTPFLLLTSVIAFLIYVRIVKIHRLSNIYKAFKVVFSILIAASITSLTVFFIDNKGETNDIYLIPQGFEGDVYAFYNIKGAPKVKTEDGYEVHVINEKGYFLTSKPDMDYGTVTDKYFYVDEKGNRTPISNKCVSLFGTGGFSTTSGHEKIDLRYTGFNLTKDRCSQEFMTAIHGWEEKKETIIHEIVKEYYGVELGL
ncbi:hypothetical protein DRW41_03925 [Neobacillus piezotolerans]|uniref:DUF6843 domain-containing protein n=1 Tax=Neobacillus piezotolerans TaxID=2259171 RepID=A0A3D8GXC5_9BACI|nr:hypothetical protein [Neobacillus piezotolerans]RDU38716.1 hypothetical protein DRW41_03925 [Neobacillus piezotolerans]